MTRSRPARILTVLLLALSGCGYQVLNPLAPPVPTSLTASGKLESAIARAIKAQEDTCQWEESGGSSSCQIGPDVMYVQIQRYETLHCDPDVLDSILRALKAELENEAQAAGVWVHEPSEVIEEGRLKGFGIEYTAGKVVGRFKAVVENGTDGEQPSFKLRVSLVEEAP
jgi:hypothetical protein